MRARGVFVIALSPVAVNGNAESATAHGVGQARDNRAMEENNTPNPAAAKPALPDRLSADPSSKFHVAEIFQHDIGIRFNGKDRRDVEEYCISEGWVSVPSGKTVDRKGNPVMIKLKGAVEAFYR